MAIKARRALLSSVLERSSRTYVTARSALLTAKRNNLRQALESARSSARFSAPVLV